MQVSVEKTSELVRKMTVTIPEEEFQQKMDARFKSLVREVRLDGFRPGKVPLNVVKKQFGHRVHGEVSGDLIQSSYYEALQEQGLVPAGQPHIHPSDNKEGLEYVAEFEVYPEISLQGIEQLEIVRPISTVTDNDIDTMIAKLRKQKMHLNLVDRVAQEGDRITINFSGVCEGESFTDGRVSDYPIEIGSKQMIPGFEEQLIGMGVGENKSFELVFPEEYGNKKLAGKMAQFEVSCVKVEEAILPEVDEAFIKDFGIEDGDREAFRHSIKANMERELERKLRDRLKLAVMDAVYEKIKIVSPKVLVDQEIEAIKKPYIEQAEKQNKSDADVDIPQEVFEAQAERRVTLGLILGEIIRDNEIKVDDDKVRREVVRMAETYENPEEVVNWYYSDQNRLKGVQQMVLEDQTVDWIVSQARMTEDVVNFDEVMESQQN